MTYSLCTPPVMCNNCIPNGVNVQKVAKSPQELPENEIVALMTAIHITSKYNQSVERY